MGKFLLAGVIMMVVMTGDSHAYAPKMFRGFFFTVVMMR